MSLAQAAALLIALMLTLMLTLSFGGCAPADDSSAIIGYVEADWRYIAAPDAGWIDAMPVSEGDRVDIGDVLFELDTEKERAAKDEADARVRQSEAQAADIATGARADELSALNARLAEAKARLTQAETDYERVMPLVAQALEPRGRGIALTAERDAARAKVQALQSDLRVAELAARDQTRNAADAATSIARAAGEQAAYRLAQRTTRARHAGRVESLIMRTGEYANKGTPVLAILPDDGLRVRFFVPQSALPSIALGDAVTVSADGLTGTASATVVRIATEAEFAPPVLYTKDSREKLVFMVEARLPADVGLRPGLPVDIHR